MNLIITPFAGYKNINTSINSKKTNLKNYKLGQRTDDIFIKNNDISFTSSQKPSKTKDILTDLTAVGVVGAPFILSIAAASYMAKGQNPSDIFLPDGTYFMNTKDKNTVITQKDLLQIIGQTNPRIKNDDIAKFKKEQEIINGEI